MRVGAETKSHCNGSLSLRVVSKILLLLLNFLRCFTVSIHIRYTVFYSCMARSLLSFSTNVFVGLFFFAFLQMENYTT